MSTKGLLLKLIHFYVLCCFIFRNIYAREEKVLLNHGIEPPTCMTSIVAISFAECLSHFRSNTSFANVIVYKRRFTLCYMYFVAGNIISKQEPGSILVHGSVVEVRDCLALFEIGCHDDGVYTIQPISGSSIQTWCDMTNGGWTVIQRRMDGSEDFYRTWTDYVQGFGNRTGEYWIGLENIFELTSIESSLRIEMETFGDVSPTKAYAIYQEFKVDNEASNYTLHVSGFSGDCGDSLIFHDGNMFSTKDKDNDQSSSQCAERFKGGWWYSACHHSNLNGLYLSGNHETYADGMNWFRCWTYYYSIRSSIMKVKRN